MNKFELYSSLWKYSTFEPRYSAIEGSEKNSHKIEFNFEGFLVEGTKNFSH
jgi:hypothetical protein